MDNIDSAAVEEGLPSEFNSIFVETNHHQLVNNENIQMPNLTQQNNTGLIDIPNNIQDQQLQEEQEQVERGSSCGSSTDDQQAPESDEAISSKEETKNVTASVFTNASSPTISHPDEPPENGPNMPPPGTSSSSDENSSLSKSKGDESELRQPQNQNLGLMNHAQDNNGGEISSGTAVVNAPNMQPLGTISSGSPTVAGAPQQHSPTSMDYRHPELRSLAGSNWSNSANLSQNPMIQPTLSSFQLRNQNRSLGINSPNATDIPRSLSSVFNGNILPLVTMGMSTVPQESLVLQPFRQEDIHQPNLMYPFSNAFSESVPQVLLEQYLPVMGVIGQYGTNNVQPFQLRANNNFMDSNISQQPSLFSNLFLQNTMTGTGVANQNSQLINPQHGLFAPFSMLNAAYNPPTTVGLWPQYLPNQPQPQQFSQVPPMANIAFDTNLEYSSPLGPQNISYFPTNHQPSNIAPAAYDRSLLYNSMMPEGSLNSRPPYFSYPHQQHNEVQPAANTSVIPESNAMPSRVSLTLDTGVRQLDQPSVIPSMVGPQEYSKNFVTATSVTSTSSGPSSLSKLSSTNQRERETLPNVPERLPSSTISKPSILTRSRARSQQNNDLRSPVVAKKPDPIESLMYGLAQNTKNGLPKEMSGTTSGPISGTTGNGTIPPDYSQILNSQTEQKTVDHQQEGELLITGVPNIPDQCVTSPMKELGEAIYGRRGRARHAPKRLETGESMSLLSKRVRRDNQEVVRQESDSVAAAFVTQNAITFGTPQSEENNAADSTKVSSQSNDNARRITNGVYDPKYEAMGLPIDPHLRMFASLNQKKGSK